MQDQNSIYTLCTVSFTNKMWWQRWLIIDACCLLFQKQKTTRDHRFRCVTLDSLENNLLLPFYQNIYLSCPYPLASILSSSDKPTFSRYILFSRFFVFLLLAARICHGIFSQLSAAEGSLYLYLSLFWIYFFLGNKCCKELTLIFFSPLVPKVHYSD